ncbi:MAG: serine/threonine-protein phosphatase [SAR324 cluster bacterium]|nr:serine/threonine-protein phosphatase [SAR324 cluster bacterium]
MSEESLFSREERAISKAEAILDSLNCTPEQINAAFCELLTDYKKLYKQMSRLLKINDKNQLVLKDLTDELRRTSTILEKQNHELQADLKIAAEIQKQIFELDWQPSFLQIESLYFPHSHVSGDIYHMVNNLTDRVDIFLGDATGHGVGAALSTIMAYMVLIQHEDEPSLVRVMEQMNHIFVNHLPEDRFLSGVFLRIFNDGRLRISNCGHPDVLIIPASGEAPLMLNPSGPLLGIIPGNLIHFKEEEYRMNPGDLAFLYTDGLTEAFNNTYEQLGLPKVVALLREYRQLPLKEILSKLVTLQIGFTMNRPRDDDMTMIAVRYTGQ